MQIAATSRFPRQLALSLLCATLALPTLNLLIDPAEVFNTSPLPYTHQVNDRYRKFDYLLNHCSDCTGFLLGSSRMGYTDPALFTPFLRRGRCYNMNISSANAWDYLEFARYLRRKGVVPELLVVQIDVTHLYGHSIRYEQHPDFSGESPVRFYFENLFSLPYKSAYGKLRNNLKRRDLNKFDWQTGQRSKPDAERQLQQDADAYVRTRPEFRVTAPPPLVGSERFRDAADHSVEAIRELVRLADEEGVRLILFVAPHNQHYLDQYRTTDVEYFLAALADVTPFWNFASYSSVNSDDRNYYEMEHHRPRVSELMVARISGRTADVPEDFGRWVTHETIDAVLEEVRTQFEARRRAGRRHE